MIFLLARAALFGSGATARTPLQQLKQVGNSPEEREYLICSAFSRRFCVRACLRLWLAHQQLASVDVRWGVPFHLDTMINEDLSMQNILVTVDDCSSNVLRGLHACQVWR